MKSIAVIGSGSWGTALSILLQENGHKVELWSFQEKEKQKILENHENKEFLPGIYFPEEISITTNLKEAIIDKDIVVFAVPSRHMRAIIEESKSIINKKQLIVNVSKGLELDSLKTLSQVILEVLPNQPVVVLSGPSHAEEVGKKIPTTVVAASENISYAEEIQDVFMNKYFRVYTNQDVLGVELGGAFKNVIALAAGISDGLGYGDNTKAALMTRGMAEIIKLGLTMGVKIETLNGLAGIGDLIVTCTSIHSRNRRAGILLGKGKKLNEVLEEVHMVVEGVHTAKAAKAFAEKFNVEMPIINEINNVLFSEKSGIDAVNDLMNRDKRLEHYYLNK